MKDSKFVIAGQVQLENKEACSDDLPLRAFAFGARGNPIGTSDVSANGDFVIAAEIKEPEDVEITSTPFNITAKVNQENGRLNQWSLTYVKGLNIASGTLDSDSSDTGLAVPVNQAVSSAPMTAGLTGTCAFSLTISAWAHIRNGYGLVYHTSKSYALAVDACACPQTVG